MMIQAIRKAVTNGMKMSEVKEVLRKCGYDLTITTHVNTELLEAINETPGDDPYDEPGIAPPDGADFFAMAKAGVGVYRRATIRKLWNPNFVSAMALLGSPLEDRR